MIVKDVCKAGELFYREWPNQIIINSDYHIKQYYRSFPTPLS